MPSPSDIRDELQRLVVADLMGPAGGPEEVIDERTVRGRYLVGMLAPKGKSALPEESETLAQAGVDDEDGTAEPPEPAAATMLASSIGLTFAVAGEAEAIRITARWGRYERIRAEDEAHRRPDGTFALVWKGCRSRPCRTPSHSSRAASPPTGCPPPTSSRRSLCKG